jgi:photosystem II stability/assembly factor-like uncharacterized protein
MQKKIFSIITILVATTALFFFFQADHRSTKRQHPEQAPPDDYFFAQRAFPYPTINYTAWNEASKIGVELRKNLPKNSLNLQWQLEGPLNTGGRISAVEAVSETMQTMYVGAASGGIFKTTDFGQSWTPIFDNALSLSIGDIAIAPSDENIIYAGTGEANAGGGSVTYDGAGLYRSSDAGASWNYLGLPESGSVGRIAVHPQNPDILYVATMGRMFSNNQERGVYKSINGGFTWQKVLFLNDSTGSIDLMIDPQHPDTVYAAMWERVRRPGIRVYGGNSCGIYRTVNGGQQWTKLTNGLQQGINQGRIGISLCHNQPNVLYAIYADATGYFSSVYRSNDYGNSWTQTNDAALGAVYANFGWWFGRIKVDPVDPEIAYVIGMNLFKTSDGGNSWGDISTNIHVDQHALFIHPWNHNNLVLGNDGGLYKSEDQGNNWAHLNNIPLTQFYTCEYDNQHPERLYGGTQDNGTIRTMTGATNDWNPMYWGDGFRVIVDPTDNNIIYAEYQYCGLARSDDGGINWNDATFGLSNTDRYNWHTPYTLDPTNPAILYLGSNRIYKSIDQANTWNAISGDLSNGFGGNMQVYGTVSCLSVSPVDPNIILAGTDDGNVWITQTAGGTWTKVSGSLPLRWISSVENDPFVAGKAYVSLSGFRYDEYLPHIFMTTNYGQTWTSISGNLPDMPVNKVFTHPQNSAVLFAATDIGVFHTIDQGVHWTMLGTGLPNVPITDLKYHPGTHTLIAATYGRSMYSLNIETVTGLDGLQANIKLKTWYSFNAQSIVVEGLGNEKASYSLYTLDGKILQSGVVNAGMSHIQVQHPFDGICLISIIGQRDHYSGKLLITAKK